MAEEQKKKLTFVLDNLLLYIQREGVSLTVSSIGFHMCFRGREREACVDMYNQKPELVYDYLTKNLNKSSIHL